MKTFSELGTLPKVGDLIMRRESIGWEHTVFMITKISGDTYHISKKGWSFHVNHLRTHYSPLSQETL